MIVHWFVSFHILLNNEMHPAPEYLNLLFDFIEQVIDVNGGGCME
jgi:hypothetical protein